MLKKGKNNKILAWLGIVGMVFLQTFPIMAQAAIIPSSLTGGVNVGATNSLTNLTTTIATAENKMKGPSVTVSFTADDSFKVGTMATATATTSGFTDSTDNLYYTWYIKHNNKKIGLACDISSTITDDNTNCDLDGDGEITVNDWKIAAAKIIVDGAFNGADVDYNNSSFVGDSAGGAKADPSVTSSSNGWIKNFKRDSGGYLADENDKDAPNCYFQQPTSGVVYELNKTKPAFDSCPSGYHPSCIKDSTTTCFTGGGTSNNTFAVCKVMKDVSASDATITCKTNNDDIKNYKASLDCGDTSEAALCTRDGSDTNVQTVASNTVLGSIFASSSSDDHMCAVVAKPDPLAIISPTYYDNTNPQISASAESCSNLASELTNGVMSSTDVIMGNTNIGNTCTFEKDANLCKHLFPYFPKEKVTLKNGDTVNLKDDATGDGSFTMTEKEFWGADPTTGLTNGKQKDEAAVMGLGVDSLKWIYTDGDEIGVAVEGKSDLLTDKTEVTWALSKGVCSKMEKKVESNTSIDNNTRGFYTENNGSNGFLTADFNLDDCLAENLLSPKANGTDSMMTVGLTSTPSGPMNDPDGASGDSVTVAASVQNVTDPSSVYYDWKIEKNSDDAIIPTNDTTWTDITTEMINNPNTLSSADTQGLGKNSLKFLLNLPATIINPNGHGEFYIRVRVTAAENSGVGNQTSSGSIIIKVAQQLNQIKVQLVTASEDGLLGFNAAGSGICNDPAGEKSCPVTQNQIVGIKIPNDNKDLSNFGWTVNNVSMTCTSDISSECKDPASNVLFFPALGNVGEGINVVATALSAKSGGTVEISRFFNIVEPQVQIVLADASGGVWPKLLGKYLNSSTDAIDGVETADYSTQVFETNPGNTVNLKAVVSSAWNYQGQTFNWTIDGQTQVNSSDTISFVVDRNIGDNYNVGLILSEEHTPDQNKQANLLRKILLKNWNISPEDSAAMDKTEYADVQINVVGTSSSQTVAKASQTGIFASLVTNLPEQLMFLLKITLTGFMLIFLMGLLFAFIPDSLFEKSKKE